MPFDAQGALKAGATEDQIIGHLTATRGFDVEGALKAGATKAQIIDHLAQMDAPAPKPEERTVGGFASNVLSSGGKLVTDAAQAVMHPIDTVTGLGTAALGAVEKVIPGEQSHEKAADAIGQFYKQRYGGLDAVKKTMYDDPVGFLSDLSTVLGGGGAALKGAATVSKSAKLADAAAIAAKAAEVTNPVSIVAKGAGAVADAAGEKLSKARNAAAESFYRGALRPRIDTPAGEVRAMVNTGLENSIPVSESGAKRLNELVQNLENQMQPAIDQAARRGVTVEPGKVVTRLTDTEKQFGLQVNPEKDLAAINKSGDEFLRTQGATKGTPAGAPQPTGVLDAAGNPIMKPGTPAVPAQRAQPIPADQAQAIKRGTYRKIQTDYGDLSTAQIEAQKALARGIKEELETQIPEIKALNQNQGKLLDLQPLLEKAVNKAVNAPTVGVGTMAAGAAGSIASGSAAGGAALGVLQKVMANPEIRSRLALLLYKGQQQAQPGKFASLAKAAARIDQYANGLAQAGKVSVAAKQ